MTTGCLTLELRGTPPAPVDVAGLHPSWLQTVDLATIARQRLPVGRQQIAAGELFRISGEPAENVVFQGDCRRLQRIGAGLQAGRILVDGDGGDELGCAMKGGQIEVRGSVGDWLAASLRGGAIHVQGDCGDYLGAPRTGERAGMSGGRVIVEGDAGQGTGHRLRRGSLVIKGTVDRYCGAEMVAGTIVAPAGAASHDAWETLGQRMRRGTIVLPNHPCLSPIRFSAGLPETLGFAKLLANELDATLPQFASRLRRPCRRCLGDRTVAGLGELLLLARH
jgi:formylmethanofuran dehydrogenase subunit C